MTGEEYPHMNDEHLAQLGVDQAVDYSTIIDEERARQQECHVGGELVHVAQMRDLAPDADWIGSISAAGEQALDGREATVYNRLLGGSMRRVQKDGQLGCIDGRWSPVQMLLGPKTAAGTLGNAYRLMLASNASGPEPMTLDQAFSRMTAIDAKFGLKSGTHAPGQCGAQKFSAFAIHSIANHPDHAIHSAQTFMGAVGYSFSQEAESRLIVASQNMSNQLGDTVAADQDVQAILTEANPDACPELARSHVEKAIVVFEDADVTLDNNALIIASQKELGRELHAFGYNWGYHLAAAKELGGDLGDMYLHSVVSQDVPVLTQLTDGSLPILAFKKSA